MKGASSKPPYDPGESKNLHDLVNCMSITLPRKLSNQSPMSDSETQIRRQSSGLDKRSICSMPSPMQESCQIGRQISENNGTFEWWISKFNRSSNRSRFEIFLK